MKKHVYIVNNVHFKQRKFVAFGEMSITSFGLLYRCEVKRATNCFNLCRNNITLQVEHNVARITIYPLVQVVEHHIPMLQVAARHCDK